MSSIGKKILGAFVDMDDKEEVKQPESVPAAKQEYAAPPPMAGVVTESSEKFRNYFANLFKDANMPGPDYYEFTKMVEAMSSIPDEKMRYTTAFAGLSIQGLDKKKLLDTAAGYLNILDSDANNFHSTVDKALQEKVVARKKEMEDKSKRIQELTREISDLTMRLELLNKEIKENEEKINANSGSYQAELANLKNKINQDLQKINHYIP